MKDTRLDVEDDMNFCSITMFYVQQVIVIFLDSPCSCIASLYCSNGE